MKQKISSLLAVGVLLLAGCSSTPTRVDTGAVKAATFSFVTTSRTAPDFSEKRAQVHQLIQQAITENLAKKGVNAVPSGGDVTVAYLVILGNNVATTAVNDYFGYGRDATALLDQTHQQMSVDNNNPNYFEAGTLIVDVVDSKTGKLLYRSHVVRPLLRNIPADARAEHVQSAVNEVLADLKIAR